MSTQLKFVNRDSCGNTNVFNVLKFKFSMEKKYNERLGAVDMRTFLSEFEVEIVGNESMRMFLFGCYINHEFVSGEIVVDNSQNSIYDNEPDTRILKFDNAVLFRLSENFDLHHDKYCFTIGFVCEHVTVDNTEFSFLSSSIRI